MLIRLNVVAVSGSGALTGANGSGHMALVIHTEKPLSRCEPNNRNALVPPRRHQTRLYPSTHVPLILKRDSSTASASLWRAVSKFWSRPSALHAQPEDFLHVGNALIVHRPETTISSKVLPIGSTVQPVPGSPASPSLSRQIGHGFRRRGCVFNGNSSFGRRRRRRGARAKVPHRSCVPDSNTCSDTIKHAHCAAPR